MFYARVFFLFVFFFILNSSLTSNTFQSSVNFINPPARTSDTSLISSQANWRGIAQPGRNVMVKGDTVSVVFSQTTSDYYNFQIMYQAYSTDAGNSWVLAQLGTANSMRTYPHQAQIWDDVNSLYPYSATSYVYWLQRYYPSLNGETYYAYDQNIPSQNFTTVQISQAITYLPTGAVWKDGHCFCTGADATTDDIYSYCSSDYGVTWDSSVIIPIDSGGAQIAPICDRGRNGYVFMYYGRKSEVGSPMYNYYRESTDYGQTWSDPHKMMIKALGDSLGYSDTLSLRWSGYSLIVDYSERKPYALATLWSNAFTTLLYGEIYFIKPSGGYPGNWIFDSLNPTPLVVGDTMQFDQISHYPTIGYYYDMDSNIILYAFCLGKVDTIGTDIYGLMSLTSTDEGNTWDVQFISPFLNDSFTWHFPSVSYYLGSNNSVHLVLTKERGENDYDSLHLYHISFDVVNDLGLPQPGSYVVGVEEQPVEPVPAGYRIDYSLTGGKLVFNLALPAGGNTILNLYDVSGRDIDQLVNRYLSAGNYCFPWDQTVPAGNYLYRLTSGGFTHSGKIQIIE